MTRQSEEALEEELIKQLKTLDYEYVDIANMTQLETNLKTQLEKLNNTQFNDKEFQRILTYLEGGSIYDKSKKFRDRFRIQRKNNENFPVKFFDKRWCKNTFQVAHQINNKGKYNNRYDVTILINGLPLVQIELKRRGIELKEAFNQTQRYQQHSYKGIFQYIQIFVISNGVNTKYYANNKNLNFKFTFFWKDKNNINIANIHEFTDIFLDKYHLHKMIQNYIILIESQKELRILRAYQYYAVEEILDKTLHTKENGYIWHTTGSGKTLTSFKASQILSQNKDIDKVIFVVDRLDLDSQTLNEFNKFSEGSVDNTDNTKTLIKHLKSNNNKLIITTIQKLSKATKNNYNKQIQSIKDKKIVLMFDECHRSQFGQMHKDITSFFTNIQYFGFTGTPILQENAYTKTTHDIFGQCLHKYLINDAIADENVLGFCVEYIGKYTNKTLEDININGINETEVMESPKRISKIVEYIIQNHDKKTRQKEFTSILAVSSIEALTLYYDTFKQKEHNLKIATIYSFEQNPDLKENKVHPRDKLEEYIRDYNKMFDTNYSTDTFQQYYQDISKKSKNRKIDILLVVNMFLTGFDNPYLNTLYVDKPLEYHGLLQAYSRTNRLLNDRKPFGNIVSFRNLKENTDKALKLFSTRDANETILMKPYNEYVAEFNKETKTLNKILPDIKELDKPENIETKEKFVKTFRNLLRTMNKLQTFTEFKHEDLILPEQDFEDYKSKYLDIYEYTQNPIEKESILNDIDFETELLRQDYINLSYILNLLKELDPKKEKEFENDRKHIIKTMEKDQELRSKIELIDKFIDKNMVQTNKNENTEEELEKFMEKEKEKEIDKLIEEEDLKPKIINNIIQKYEYDGKIKSENVKESFNQKIKFKERKTKKERVIDKIKELVNKFKW